MRQWLEKTIEEVKKAGAEGDVILQSSKSLKLSAFGNELTEYKVSGAQVLGLRVIRNNKVGLSYTESLAEESIRNLVKVALDNASASSVNEHEAIAHNEGEVEDIELYQQEEVDIETKISQVTGFLDEFKTKDSRVQSLPYNGYVENENFNLYMNTHQRLATRKDQFVQAYVMPLLVENEKKSAFYDFSLAHQYQDIDWERLKNYTIDTAATLLSATKIKTGKYQVMFTLDCLSSFFQKFGGLFSAKSVINKTNPWEKMLGKMVMHEDLTLVDDSLFKDAFSHYRFDSEGFNHKKVSLIENGVLKTFLHNSATAKELGQQNTFHALRSPGSALGVGRTNFILHSLKNHAFNDSHVEIIQLDGLYSGSNEVTGDFSCGVKGFLVKDGERIPFADATLSGNFFEMLKKLSVIDPTLHGDPSRSLFAPKIVFHDLSLAGQG